MTRNTKEISLIQIRSGDLAQLPKALHQAEFGLAKDKNRLFIGNAINTYLANRTSEFPYQNLEILTEFSELKDYFKYSYENNILSVNGETKRSDYKEYLPIVVNCEVSNPIIPTDATIKINGVEISLKENDDMGDIIDKINQVSDETHTYATMLSGTQSLTIICFLASLSVEDTSDVSIVNDILGFPTTYNANILMPERKVTEKLDDFLNISDFGIKGDGQTNSCDKIFNALIEVYKNFKDPQFYRNILFPAGTYKFDIAVLDGTSSTVYYPFPLISNLRVHGEGIDRTIIKASTDYKLPLLNCVDDNLIISSFNDYGKNNKYPSNIVIEDMTFKSGAEICNLSSVSNITFNRVKFYCDGISDLVSIVGKEGYESCNITFNECIFEGGNRSIFVSEFTKNITITNCQFNNSYSKAIELGEDNSDNPVYGINISSNIFTNCYTSASAEKDNCIIKLGKNAQYVSIHQSIFDKEVVERTGLVIPYIDYDDENRKNFIDTLDPTTDSKKILKFNFTQPQWEFLNYLCNSDGEVVLTIDGQDSDITAPNGLNITQDDYSVTIKSVGSGDVVIEQNNDSNLILGKGTDGNSNGSVILNKALDINDNKITNENGVENIVFKPSPDKFLEIESNTYTDTPYEQIILGQDNAIPNVAYVEKAATSSVLFKLNTDILKNSLDLNNAVYDLLTFDKAIYGNNVYLKNISINIRKPFYKSYKLKSQALDYVENYTYYSGDVVKGILTSGSTDTKYGIVKNTHLATTSFYDAVTVNNTIELLSNDDLNDICFIDIIASDENGESISLTKKYNNSIKYLADDNFIFATNIVNNNDFTYNPSNFDETKIYGNKDELVKHQDKVYVIFKGESKTYNALDLHNTSLAKKKYSEGFNYIYDMDRTAVNQYNEPIDISNINFIDMKLSVVFSDINGAQMHSLSDYTQLCPSGEAIIRIDYIKNEVK